MYGKRGRCLQSGAQSPGIYTSLVTVDQMPVEVSQKIDTLPSTLQFVTVSSDRPQLLHTDTSRQQFDEDVCPNIATRGVVHGAR
jgi:hypothetical protein